MRRVASIAVLAGALLGGVARTAAAAALVGVVHVHHGLSHDSDARFEDVLAGAFEAELDFVVLTDHVPLGLEGPVPGSERAGVYRGPSGRPLLVLVGVEVGTRDGHLLGLDVRRVPPSGDVPGRDVIADIHAQGGFAVVPHPLSHGGWHDWEAPFDGLEVHNNASALRQLGVRLPWVVLVAAWRPEAALRTLLPRPAAELALWDELLERRYVIGFSGADAHQNVSLLGWQLDPYERMFRAVQTVCDAADLEAGAVWRALRSGRCFIRYSIHATPGEEAEADWVRFPSGRVERWARGGGRVLDLYQPPREVLAAGGEDSP